MGKNNPETQAKYMRKKVMVAFVLDREEDADIIRWLGKHGNRSEMMRELLKKEMERK